MFPIHLLNRKFRLLLIFALLFSGGILLQAQPYVFNGNASNMGGGCWRITPALNAQRGSIWSSSQLDLSQPFDIQWDLFFGFNNGGADGIAFVLQNQSPNIMGLSGGGLAYGGISPSLAIEFDTWQNASDPAQDHVAIQRDGNTNHASAQNIAGPVSLGNFEDGVYHSCRMVWTPSTQNLSVWFDCNLIISTTYNVQGIFGGNNLVYWGFTGSTGGAVNDQRACLRSNLLTNNANFTICPGDTLTLTANSTSASGTYTWNSPGYFATGGNGQSMQVFPPADTFYAVSYLDQCGVTHNDTFNITMTSIPSFSLGNDTTLCPGENLDIMPMPMPAGVSFLWSDGSSGTSLNGVALPGTYWLEISQGSCSSRDSIVVSTVPAPVNVLGPDQTKCPEDSILLDVTYGTPPVTYLWQNGATSPSLWARTPGQYDVEMNYGTNCVFRDTIQINDHTVTSTSLPDTTDFCPGNSVLLDPGQPSYSYLWNTGSTNTTETVNTPGTYSLTFTDGNGCTGTDTVEVVLNPQPTFSLGNDTTLCPGFDVTLFGDTLSPGLLYTWSTAASTDRITVNTAGLYWLEQENSQNCTFRDSINVSFFTAPPLDLGPDQSKCPEDSVLLDATLPGVTYNWNTGASSPTIYAPQPGQYWVEVGYQTCFVSDSILISNFNVQPTTLPNLVEVCVGDAALLDPGQPGYSYLWNTGATSNTLTVNTPGTYSLIFTDPDGCEGMDTSIVANYPVPTVTLPTDTATCFGNRMNINPGPTNFQYSWSNGSTNRILRTRQGGTFILNFTDPNGCSSSDSVDVTIWPLPEINLPNDTILCEGTLLSLDAGDPSLTYSWSTGETSQAIPVSNGGTFSVVFTDGNGCTDSLEVEVDAFNALAVDLGADIEVCGLQEIMLDANPDGQNDGAGFLWNTGEDAEQIVIENSGVYSVTVENTCFTVGDTVVLEVIEGANLWVPTGFTPNGDGLNDEFVITAQNSNDFEIQIFDRWGGMIFSSNDPQTGWDGRIKGKPAPEGAYTYVIRFTNCLDQPDVRPGNIMLIR